ncbi:MAG: glycosyltransferase [Clostridia bacterium]|nr:glycosyltransferase [Clostridia bacterium]
MEDLVTVIVPVYNGEKTIKRCIESILNQTYRNIEIIIVNDGSEDNSGQICRMLQSQCNNIVFIEQENCGASEARNAGIRIARGRYITFLDCDDTIYEDFIEKMHMSAEQNSDALVVTGMKVLVLDSQGRILKINDKIVKTEKNVLSMDMRFVVILHENNLLASVGNKLYDARILLRNNLFFGCRHISGEDLLFNLQYARYMHNIVVVNEPLYTYYLAPENTLHTAPQRSRFCSIQATYREFIQVLDKFGCGKEAYEFVCKAILEEFLFAIRLYCMNSDESMFCKMSVLGGILKSREYKEVFRFYDEVEMLPLFRRILKYNNAFLICLYFVFAKLKHKRKRCGI